MTAKICNVRTALRAATLDAVRTIHEDIRAGRFVSPRAVRRVLRMNEIAHAMPAPRFAAVSVPQLRALAA